AANAYTYTAFDKGNSVARRTRKAQDLPETAGLPKKPVQSLSSACFGVASVVLVHRSDRTLGGSIMRSVKFLVLILVLALVPVAAAWADTSYVLVAPNWGAKQTAAVQMAGGIVLSSHDRAGIGIVTSNVSDFLSRALASNSFQYGAADQIIEW